jgi:SOS-response transcriptional repressor LexA
MPAAVIPIRARCQGEYVLLQLALPGQPVHNVGVLLLDTASEQCQFRLRRHWDDLAGAEDAEYLASLDRDFRDKIAEMGAHRFLESLEDSLSHILLVTERQAVPVDSFSRVADRLFEQHVEPLPVERYRTHLPLYTLRAAAGKFGADEEVEEEDWVRAPEGMRLTEGMFVAHVEGRSMEPRIADRSLNLFRAPVVGSRQGKIVLVELLDVHEKYTVKRYTSKKVFRDEEWEHESIRLEPLNPEFEPLDLEPDRLRVIAEWICTLE